MKKLMMVVLSIFVVSIFLNGKTPTDPQKMIIGSWVNPYTYASSGELKGFKFSKGGKCEAINIPSLDLKSWEIKKNRLIIKGFDIDEKTGKRSEYETSEPIDLLNEDTLRVVATEIPRSCFVYINQKTLLKKAKAKK